MIPEWNAEGVLPPINEDDPTGFDRAPYEVSLVQVVDRFATSLERCDILFGYLAHRAELHKMGINKGFQWLDGSFTEDIEMLEHRPPRDIDVVTFTSADDTFFGALGVDEINLLGGDRDKLKQDFKIDFYVQSLSDPAESLVAMTTYWYSMWSHRRTGQWKGFLKVDLSSTLDVDAENLLVVRRQELAHEQI
ncbi:hypothetical protein J3P96_04810 [Pseudomonas sp. R3-56]|uniref:DUF6932 family protein n=1 Tax=Pseudomonas sp. R3-56 TaxID=2817401 RepID=UPI003DA8C037